MSAPAPPDPAMTRAPAALGLVERGLAITAVVAVVVLGRWAAREVTS